MKAISNENRTLIIAAKERGETPESIAIWFNVAVSSVYNILALYKKTNDISPKPHLGRPCRLTENDLENIRCAVKKNNDITLEELIEKLNLPIKKSRLSEVLIEMDLSFKKRRSTQADNCVKTFKKNEKTGKLIKKN